MAFNVYHEPVGTTLTQAEYESTSSHAVDDFNFLELTDTPDSYTGHALKFVRVNGSATGLEFVASGVGGTISGVDSLNTLMGNVTISGAGIITVSTAAGKITISGSSSGGSGEVNTASNLGTGQGVFKNKSGVDLRFRSLVAASGVTITSGVDTISLSSNDSQIIHQNLSGKGTYTHAQIDTHIANISNPHTVNASQVGSDTAQWNANRLYGVYLDSTYSAPSDGQSPIYRDSSGKWELVVISGGGGTFEVVSDSTPQLGGDLDCNGKNIRLENNTYLQWESVSSGTLNCMVLNSSDHLFVQNSLPTKQIYIDSGGGIVLRSNNSSSVISSRFYIAGGTDTVAGTWYNIEHTGLKLGGTLDANSQQITNAVLTSPAINGTVTTIGLTLPAHTSGLINSVGMSVYATNTSIYVSAVNLPASATGLYAAIFGLNAGKDLTDGEGNHLFGVACGAGITTGDYNCGFGDGTFQAVVNPMTGSYNCGFGDHIMPVLTSGSYNTGIGSSAMNDVTVGTHNTGIGYAVMSLLTEGTHNTVIGATAGNAITTGDHNTIIGAGAAPSLATTDRSIIIGKGAGQGVTTEYTFCIDSREALLADAYLWGSMNNSEVTLGLGSIGADAGNTLRNTSFTLRNKYWNGSASTAWDFKILHVMEATTPKSHVDFRINAVDILTLINNNGTCSMTVKPDGTNARLTVADTAITLSTSAPVSNLKLGNSLTLNSQAFDAGAVSAIINTTGQDCGLNITSTQDTVGGVKNVYYQNSASPATNDVLYTRLARGKNSADGVFSYGYDEYYIVSPTAGSESSGWRITLKLAGSSVGPVSMTGSSVIWNTAVPHSNLKLGNAMDLNGQILNGAGTINGITGSTITITSLRNSGRAVSIENAAVIVAVDQQFQRFRVANSNTLTTAASGTHALVAGVYLDEPNITIGTAPVTLAATLYIAGASTEAASNYALYIASGDSYFGGYVKLHVTDTDGTVEGQLWYDASEDKLKYKTAAGVETVIASGTGGGPSTDTLQDVCDRGDTYDGTISCSGISVSGYSYIGGNLRLVSSSRLELGGTGSYLVGDGTTLYAVSNSANAMQWASSAVNCFKDFTLSNCDIVLSDNQVKLDPEVGTGSSSGMKRTGTAGHNLVFGDLVHKKPDGKFWKAVAAGATDTATGQLAMALETITGDNTGDFLVLGYATLSTWSWATSSGLYISDVTSGVMVQTAPVTSGHIARIVGWAEDSNTIYFCPDNTYIEVT